MFSKSKKIFKSNSVVTSPLVDALRQRLLTRDIAKLKRSNRPWSDKLLRNFRILFGGASASFELYTNRLKRSGAIIFHDKLYEPSLDEFAEKSQTSSYEIERFNGLVYDASEIRSSHDLEEVYRFFRDSLPLLEQRAHVVLIAPDWDSEEDLSKKTALRALHGFVKSLAREMGRLGTNVLILSYDKSDEAIKRLGPCLEYFLSDHSSYVTGQIIKINDMASGQTPRLMAGSLAGKIALVTGAARGIGNAIARALANEGVLVVVLDHPKNAESLRRLSQEIEGIACNLQLGTPSAAEELSDFIKESVGEVDILIHNAGVTRDRTLMKMSRNEWRQVLNVNLQAVEDTTKQLLEDKIIKDSGRIITMSSISGLGGNFGQSNYSAAKAGLIAYSQGLADQLKNRGITVNAIAPGFIDTQMTAAVPFVLRQMTKRLTSLGQSGKPQDVAELATFIASPNSIGITGSVLRVCGGHMLGT